MAQTHGPTRRRFLTISGVGIAGAHLAGCGVGGGSAEARRVLEAAFSQPINDLDPHGPASVDEATLLACRLIYDTLVLSDGEEIQPNVAESWEQPDETTWIFHLRDDVRFHDGTPLTARDVRTSIERVRDAGTAQSALWQSVVDFEENDDHTLTVITEEPLGTMLTSLTVMYVLPADRMEEEGFFQAPVGSGPFQVESFTPASELSLTPTSEYWGERSSIDGVVLPYVPEISSQVTSLRTGDLHAMWPVPPDQLPELQGVDGITLETVPSYVYYFAWFNCGREPFTDPRVRRALRRAVDVDGIVENLFGDGAAVMTAPVPSAVFGHAAQEPYEYDPERARQELAEAGYPDGFTTSMMWFDATGPLARELAQSLISDWAEIGVVVEPQSIEKAEWIQRLNDLEWDMEMQVNTVTTGDADFALGRLYTSEANRLGYANEELDEILGEANRSSDQDRREELYAKACQILWDDAVGLFPAELISTYGLRDDVSGFVPAPSNQPDLRSVALSS
ncbi:MAG TPA: ABC transporter substrate-binding protein [Candidatus Nocardiopsis merdipullorum]|nr:ABC transporter substrate-binding protein [Candidatus Nocardiopsis merdipullorum]